MRFSIIIPVYNVEKYIDKCMASVMGQSFDDFEVIVVDDETPDNSMAVVQKYVDAYPGKIRVVHQKNTRQGGARNRGVSLAGGEYILFVDSDDYVDRDMLKTADERLRENPSDILVFQHVPVTESGDRIPAVTHGAIEPGTYYPQRDSFTVLLPTGPVNKAFRRTFYLESGVSFPEKLLYEDAVMRLLYAKAKSITVCGDVLYYYVQSEHSSMRSGVSPKMLDILTVTDQVLEKFREDGLYEQFKEPLQIALLYGILNILDRINRVDKDDPMQEKFADYIQSRFPDYGSNPYAGAELCRALDCLTSCQFRKYHYRFLLVPEFKEWLLRCPLIAGLNSLRRAGNGSCTQR